MMAALASRGNGRGHRRRDDRIWPDGKPDPNTPHSLNVKAENREACKAALKDEIARLTKQALNPKERT